MAAHKKPKKKTVVKPPQKPKKKTPTKMKARSSRKPHIVAKPAAGYSKQVGYLVDARFHTSFAKAAADRGYTFSEVTRGLQENWLKKQLDRAST